MKLILILLLMLSCYPEDICNENIVDSDSITVQINQYRNSQGLNELEKDSYVSGIAMRHTNYMIKIDSITHYGFEQRAKLLKKYCSKSTGEILAKGYNEDTVLIKWIESPNHKKIIEGNYNRVGTGIKNRVYTVIFYKK